VTFNPCAIDWTGAQLQSAGLATRSLSEPTVGTWAIDPTLDAFAAIPQVDVSHRLLLEFELFGLAACGLRFSLCHVPPFLGDQDLRKLRETDIQASNRLANSYLPPRD